MEQEVIAGDEERIILTFELGNNRQEISYTPEHFLSLKTILALIEKEANGNE